MTPEEYAVTHLSPEVNEFAGLREKIGWGQTNLEMARTSLANSLFHVSIRHQEVLIAMGRVVGDGAMFFYIQDVIVDPDYQKQGLGHIIMENIETYLQQATQKGSTVGLLAARGKEAFYRRYGYLDRSGDDLGLGMCKFL